ncbi:hypothetical protein [Kallipyga massiliensis]|uniref:hypothetical protein n=1 Tax=Kallipyga massiliensis TaxID=1472764 RepID=UPI0026ED567E|nr:hypothetical protein [Kallipyga massiliensis]
MAFFAKPTLSVAANSPSAGMVVSPFSPNHHYFFAAKGVVVSPFSSNHHYYEPPFVLRRSGGLAFFANQHYQQPPISPKSSGGLAFPPNHNPSPVYILLFSGKK